MQYFRIGGINPNQRAIVVGLIREYKNLSKCFWALIVNRQGETFHKCSICIPPYKKKLQFHIRERELWQVWGKKTQWQHVQVGHRMFWDDWQSQPVITISKWKAMKFWHKFLFKFCNHCASRSVPIVFHDGLHLTLNVSIFIKLHDCFRFHGLGPCGTRTQNVYI